MAQGSTDTFAASCEEICLDALAAVGACMPGDTASTVDGKIMAYAKRMLGDLVKSIDADGQFLWRIQRLTTTTTASTAAVTISALAVDIDEPIRYTKDGETTGVPLTPMTRDEYMALPDRTITADVPSRYYIERSLSGGRATLALYLYPEPEDADDTVEYAAFLRAKDFNTSAINPDFPSSWNSCLKWGLISLIAPSFNQPAMVTQFMKLFLNEKDKLLNADNEKQGLMLVPFGGVW